VINAVMITAENLPPPGAGTRYVCWLVDQERAVVLRLGPLQPDSGTGGKWKLPFQVGETTPNFLFSGDKRLLRVLVTQEPLDATASEPTGPTILSGQFADQPFLHIQHLLVGHPVTNPPGHLVRLLRQAEILTEEPIPQLFLAIDGAYPQWEAGCAAQSIVDMIEGSSGEHYRQLPSQCTNAHFPITQVGDGHGILQHIQDTLTHVIGAEQAAGFTKEMKQGADELMSDAGNVRDWFSTANQYALEIKQGNNIHVRDLKALCEMALRGNTDTGKGGVYQAYLAAQRMATLSLTPPQ